jgi:tRNA A37 threonylcarbamoyladenosine biosynthesis protein TsaE
MDLYRLDAGQLEHLGIEEWFEPDAAIVVEWAERLGPFAPRLALHVTLSHEGDGRGATLRASGPQHAGLLERLRAEIGGLAQ